MAPAPSTPPSCPLPHPALSLDPPSLLPSSFTWGTHLQGGPDTAHTWAPFPRKGFCPPRGPAVREAEIQRTALQGFQGMGKAGLFRNLPHKRLCRATRQFVSEPCSCLGHFHFYLLRVVSRSWQAGDVMLMTPAPRGDHSGKSCNVLSATLIRETHEELLHGDSFPPSTCPAC